MNSMIYQCHTKLQNYSIQFHASVLKNIFLIIQWLQVDKATWHLVWYYKHVDFPEQPQHHNLDHYEFEKFFNLQGLVNIWF